MEQIRLSVKSYRWTKIVVDPDRSQRFNLRWNFSPDLVLFHQGPNERGIPKEDWHLSDQKHQWLRLAMQTHLQISPAPLCLRGSTSAKFSSPLAGLESYLKAERLPSPWNSGFLRLSDAKGANLQYLYMLCCQPVFQRLYVRLHHKREQWKCRTFCSLLFWHLGVKLTRIS